MVTSKAVVGLPSCPVPKGTWPLADHQQITGYRMGSFHLQSPYFQVRSHSQVPGDTAFVKDPIPFRSVEVDHIPIWRPGPMAWVTQLDQDDLISRSQFHLQRPYFQMRSHCQAPGDTAFGKVTIALSSMDLDHIPIWRPGPMGHGWAMDDLISMDLSHSSSPVIWEMGFWELFSWLASNLDPPNFSLPSSWITGLSHLACLLAFFF
jgi:hypothetical protein